MEQRDYSNIWRNCKRLGIWNGLCRWRKSKTYKSTSVVKKGKQLHKEIDNFNSKMTDLFVCLFVPLENFSLIWRRHHCRRRAANFDLCSALMAIEQWGFHNFPHPLRHGPTVYNGHLRGPVTLTPVAERLAVELSLPVLTTWVCRERGLNPNLPHGRRTLYLYATTAIKIVRWKKYIEIHWNILMIHLGENKVTQFFIQKPKLN